jgi:superfamily I DNA/RNA helicase
VSSGDTALLFALDCVRRYEDALAAPASRSSPSRGAAYDRPEVRDPINALAAIADPTDDGACRAAASPAIGLSDADLYRLRFTESGAGIASPGVEALNALAEEAREDVTHACAISPGCTHSGRVPARSSRFRPPDIALSWVQTGMLRATPTIRWRMHAPDGQPGEFLST